MCMAPGPSHCNATPLRIGRCVTMAKEYRLSAERLEELKQELTYLKTVREKEVAELIKEARSFGDLSENSEYDEAKNEQGKLYSRIAELENILAFVFGLKKSPEEIGEDSSDEKLMLRSAIIAVSHKIYLEKCFSVMREEAEQKTDLDGNFDGNENLA